MLIRSSSASSTASTPSAVCSPVRISVINPFGFFAALRVCGGRAGGWMKAKRCGQLVVVGDSDRGRDRPLDTHDEGGRHEQFGDVERPRVVAGDQPGVLEPGEPRRIAVEDEVRQRQRAVSDPAAMQQTELTPEIVECRLGHLIAGRARPANDRAVRRGR